MILEALKRYLAKSEFGGQTACSCRNNGQLPIAPMMHSALPDGQDPDQPIAQASELLRFPAAPSGWFGKSRKNPKIFPDRDGIVLVLT